MAPNRFEEELLIHSQGRSSLSDSDGSTRRKNHLEYAQPNHRWFFQRIWKPVALHAALFIFYTLAFFYGWQSLRSHCIVDDTVAYVPYKGKYEAQAFRHQHSVYVGSPRKKLDDAWEELLRNRNFRVSDEEMRQIPERKQEAIALPDGGYFGSLMVYHNLHCIKRLHQYIYEDHYFPNITEAQKDSNLYHTQHCLDTLRQAVMCQGDTQILTMKWLHKSRVPTANMTMPHMCVNWEELDGWAATRRISKLLDSGYLIHPTLGPAYPDGQGSLIGELGHTEDFHGEKEDITR